MGRKFSGLAAIALSSAFLVLCSMPSSSETGSATAGLFGNRGGLFGFGLFSGCGGGGGGGLQNVTYSSCAGAAMSFGAYNSCGGGGGGGLQYMPTSYFQPTYYQQPASVYSSACPGGQCVISTPTHYSSSYAMAPVQLNPGETFVAGSLRQVTTPAASVAQSSRKAAPAETQGKTLAAASKANPQGAVERLPLVTEADEIAMLACIDCEHCDDEEELFASVGIKVRRVYVDGDDADPTEALRLWSGSKVEFVGYPSLVLLKDGKPVAWYEKPVTDKEQASKLARVLGVKEEPKAMIASAEDQKLERLELLMVELVKESRMTREALQELGRTAKR